MPTSCAIDAHRLDGDAFVMYHFAK